MERQIIFTYSVAVCHFSSF